MVLFGGRGKVTAITQATLLRYCRLVYDAFEATAVRDSEGVLVWEGSTTELFRQLGISNAHYSRVLDAMDRGGWTTRLQRGGRGLLTRYALHSQPELAEGTEIPPEGLTRPTPDAILAGRVTALERRLEGLDVKQYLAVLERRIQQLERSTQRQQQESDRV
jgi:hypothetical protein